MSSPATWDRTEWILGVAPFSLAARDLAERLAHELGHLLSLAPPTNSPKGAGLDCTTVPTNLGCALRGSVLAEYRQQTWDPTTYHQWWRLADSYWKLRPVDRAGFLRQQPLPVRQRLRRHQSRTRTSPRRWGTGAAARSETQRHEVQGRLRRGAARSRPSGPPLRHAARLPELRAPFPETWPSPHRACPACRKDEMPGETLAPSVRPKE
jgi:hypothetical protein